MQIGELAKRSNLSRDTIRFYERSGLIRSSAGPIGSNTYRQYPEDAVETLAMIREAQNAGFSIADLAYFINQIEAPVTPSFDADAFLQRKIGEVEESIRRARRFLKTLKATRDALSPRKGRADRRPTSAPSDSSIRTAKLRLP